MEKKLATALLAACLLGTVGCHAFERPDVDRLGRTRGEYVLDDDSAKSTWSQAASESLQEDETRVSALRPLDEFPTTGESKETDESFTEKLANVFHAPKTPAAKADESFERSQVAERSGSVSSNRNRTNRGANQTQPSTSAASDSDRSQNPEPRFWSKLFPPKQPARQEIAEQKAVVAPVRRSGRSNEQTSSWQLGGLKLPTSRLFSRVELQSNSKETNPEIERYDQSRFIPSSQEIEKYYYPSGVFLSQQNASQGLSFTPVTRSPAESAGGLSERADSAIQSTRDRGNRPGFSSYADSEKSEVGGSAYLSPIVHADAALPTKRYGDSDSRSFGVTRPIARSNEVSQVSYAERRPSVAGLRTSPDALFGWSSETNAVLSGLAFNKANVSDRGTVGRSNSVDANIVDALGRQDYSWLESSSRARAAKKEVSQLTEPTDDAQSEYDERVRGKLSSFPEVDEQPDASGAVDSESVMIADSGASLDDIFDSAVLAKGKNAEPSQINESFDDAADFASDDLPEDFEGYSYPDDDASDESFADEDADDSSIQQAAPLEQAVSANAVPMRQEREPDPAAQRAVSSAIPETVVERSGDRLDSPLTNEEIAWVSQIKRAIQGLLVERESLANRGADTRSCDARLRLLYLTIGEYDRSIQSIQDDSDPLKAFWEKECRGLETLLQNRLEEIDPSFVAERLSSGLESLSSFCDVKIRKSLLVNAPACYGLYEERQSSYTQGETVYAYMELDYVSSRESVKGYSIDVECRWRLVDSYGNVLLPFESQRCSNVSETKLRDVVLNVSVPLPKQMNPGEYALELEVVDLNAKEPKTSIKRLNLTVVGVTEG